MINKDNLTAVVNLESWTLFFVTPSLDVRATFYTHTKNFRFTGYFY